MLMGMDQQCVIPDNACCPTKGTVRFPILMRNMDIFSGMMMSYSVFELYPGYFKLVSLEGSNQRGSTAQIFRIEITYCKLVIT